MTSLFSSSALLHRYISRALATCVSTRRSLSFSFHPSCPFGVQRSTFMLGQAIAALARPLLVPCLSAVARCQIARLSPREESSAAPKLRCIDMSSAWTHGKKSNRIGGALIDSSVLVCYYFPSDGAVVHFCCRRFIGRYSAKMTMLRNLRNPLLNTYNGFDAR